MFALVLTPTRFTAHHENNGRGILLLCMLCRELAFQIADQFKVFGKHISLKDAVIVGGVGKCKNSMLLFDLVIALSISS